MKLPVQNYIKNDEYALKILFMKLFNTHTHTDIYLYSVLFYSNS